MKRASRDSAIVRMRRRGAGGIGAIVLACGAFPAWAAPDGDSDPARWRFNGVPRVVAVGDVHGAYDELVEVLEGTGLVSSGAATWTGGEAHLVMLGDLVDRGPRSRDALDLVRRLQRQAHDAGGRVHVLLGNHEVMNLVGDLRYTTEAELASYAAGDEAGERKAYVKRLLRQAASRNGDLRKARARISTDYPDGLFGHTRAFATDGEYGEWLLQQRLLVVVNDVAFVHGGLPPSLLEIAPDEINPIGLQQLRDFMEAQQSLLEEGVLRLDMGHGERLLTAQRLLDESERARSPRDLAAARTMLEAADGLAFRQDGLLWYRGTALGEVGDERETVEKVLAHIDARSVVVGHTPSHTGRLTARLGGMVVLADTGMLHSEFKGRASAVVLEDGRCRAYYPDDGMLPLTARRWEMAAGTFASLHETEEFLRSAPVVEARPLGTGSTGAMRVSLADDGRRCEGVFKAIEADAPCPPGTAASGCRDSWRHEVAAYRVDRVLDLGMVPPTVVRTIDGVEGSLQLWVEGAINDNARRDEDIRPDNPEMFEQELARANVFDYLVLNPGRNGSNILITQRDWAVHLIDHSAAFAPTASLPAGLESGVAGLDDELVRRLAEVDRALLRVEVEELLRDRELAALMARLDQLVSTAGARRGR